MVQVLYLIDTIKQIKLTSDDYIKNVFFIGYDVNALYLWAFAQEMPTGKHEHIETYDLKQLNKNMWNNKLFEFTHVDIERPKNIQLKEHS